MCILATQAGQKDDTLQVRSHLDIPAALRDTSVDLILMMMLLQSEDTNTPDQDSWPDPVVALFSPAAGRVVNVKQEVS